VKLMVNDEYVYLEPPEELLLRYLARTLVNYSATRALAVELGLETCGCSNHI